MPRPEPDAGEFDRALGALIGLALGDALGMPTQTLTRREIEEHYGQIEDLVAPHPANSVSRGLVAANVTDDTEQTLLLANLVLSNPDQFCDEELATSLLNWENEVKARGLHDLLGPSTKRALQALMDGESVERTGLLGTTNGAAMRISPIGISTPCEPMDTFVAHVARVCRVTHNTVEAVSGAAAVGAAVSAAVDGASHVEAIDTAVAAARAYEVGNQGNLDFPISERIAEAVRLAQSHGGEPDWREMATQLGTSSESRESIPMAFAIFAASGADVWRAGLISANLGGDTDTIGAISGGMAGALGGASVLPKDKVNRLYAANPLNFDEIVSGLLVVRQSRRDTQAIMECAG